MRGRQLALIVFCLLEIGCGPITEVVLRVDAEPGGRSRAHFLEATVVNGEGSIVRAPTPPLSIRRGDESTLPVSFGLIPEVSSRFEFTGRLLDETRVPFAELRYEGQYTEGEVEFVDLLFEDQTASVSAGSVHTCAIRDGALWCFGRNQLGEVGNGSSGTAEPTPVLLDGLWYDVSAGDRATCALDPSRHLYCWGSIENVVDSAIPVAIEPDVTFTYAVTWADVLCAIGEDEALVCFGSDSFRRQGIDPVTGPPLQGEQVQTVAVSGVHVCALTSEGRMHCWGGDESATGGTSGPGVPVDDRIYTKLAVGSGYSASISAFGTTCGIDEAGALFCFGLNSRGMLADAGPIDERINVPTRVGARSDWTDVCLGNRHACGIHSDGALECWGGNGAGQLGVGDSDRDDRAVPTRVQSSLLWAQVSCGDFTTCATSQDGTVYCWGSADSSSLGADYGSMGLRTVGQPVEVSLER